jgi:hypothetical protein
MCDVEEMFYSPNEEVSQVQNEIENILQGNTQYN